MAAEAAATVPGTSMFANFLNHGGIATLLIDLLTRDEEVVDLQIGPAA